MTEEGFFRADGDILVPAAFATSPWGPVLHGRLIGGLTARAAELARVADPELTCSRLTVDLFRAAPLAPVRVSTRPIRAGRRIAVLEVTIEQDGSPVGQGKILLLRRSQQPAGPFRPPPAWDMPTPLRLGPPPPPTAGRRWTPAWETWRVDAPSPGNTSSPDNTSSPGSPGNTAGPEDEAGSMTAGLWIRDTHPLVSGEPLNPLVRVAMAADLASPVSNYSAAGLSFINADYTVYLGREPAGEHVGIQPAGHLSEHGVAAGQCVLHDLRGPVGFVTTAAVANPTMRPQPASGRADNR